MPGLRSLTGALFSSLRSIVHILSLLLAGLFLAVSYTHLTLPTSDPSVDLGGRRIIKKKQHKKKKECQYHSKTIGPKN